MDVSPNIVGTHAGLTTKLLLKILWLTALVLFVYSLRFFFWFDLTSHNVTPKLVGFPPRKSVGPPRTWFTECHSEVGCWLVFLRRSLLVLLGKSLLVLHGRCWYGFLLLASRASGSWSFWLLELLEVLELLASGVAMMVVVEEKPCG